MTRIYVELLDEKAGGYKPVAAAAMPGGLFRITSVRSDPDEVWRFETGSIVRCRRKAFPGGEQHLVAVEEQDVPRDT